jgi:hypothetical protein
MIVTLDIPLLPVPNSDPDDVQSTVRFLLYANEIRYRGIVRFGWHPWHGGGKAELPAVLDEYDNVNDNLRNHDRKWRADFEAEFKERAN